jgi:preprotein translocase subunit SecF
MFIVKHRKIFYTLSAILVAFSLYSIFAIGLNFGIDFKGGSIIEVQYSKDAAATTTAPVVANSSAKPASAANTKVVGNIIPASTASTTVAAITGFPDLPTLNAKLAELNIGETVTRQSGDTGYIIRTKALTEDERKTLTAAIGGNVKQFDTVGPVLGQELQGKAIWSLIYILLAIVIFITFAFRKVSKPVSSWKYGIVAIIALAHDVIIPTGIFAFIGRSGGYEIDALFVTAILVILGFSVHDTIVVFDRTRENLRIDGDSGKKSFDTIVGESINQTFTRSINTSMTTVLALLALFILGPEATRNFALALIIGIITGTYSSIFIGSPLLVTLGKWKMGKK